MKKQTIIKLFSIFLIVTLFGQSVQAFNTVESEQLETAQLVTSLIDRLQTADGHIPDDFTKDEMDLFLAEADPEVVADILNDIAENAEPVPMPCEMTVSKTAQNRSETYTEYNPETGIEITHSFSELSNNGDNIENNFVSTQDFEESFFTNESNVVPRAYPEYCFEKSPQSYADTRSTCKLIIKTKGYGDYVGSGFLVSDDTMLTASHCIYSPDFGGWMDYMVIMPSYSDSCILGYYGNRTSSTVYVGNYHILPSNYRGDDWGIVKLNSAYDIGYLSKITYHSNSHSNMWIRVQGYPAVNPQTGVSGNKTMYLTSGVGMTDHSDYMKDGTAKVYKGMSGGPVLTYSGSSGKYYAAGIISGYYTDTHNVIYVAFDVNLYNLITNYS